MTLLFIAVKATATVTIVEVTGASNFVKTTTSGTTTVAAYGGTAGPLNGGCITNSDGLTCNNCNSASLTASGGFGIICNERRIVPTNNLTIAATPSIAGVLTIFSSANNARINGASTNNVPTANTTGYITVPWSQLCLAYTTATLGTVNATCEFAASTAFYVGIDKNNNGIKDTDDDVVSLTIVVNHAIGGADYTVGPSNALAASDCLFPITLQKGDGKVYLGPLPAVGTFPDSNLVPFDKYRFYISTVAITAATDQSILPFADLDIEGTSSEYSVTPDYVDGLTNGTPHFFVTAQIDRAGNMGYFNGLTVPLSETPDFVFGLLSKDFECFVATATYGSPDAKEVLTLRKFRNYLIEHHQTWAQPFIKFYYKHSPKLANFIRDSETLKFISRILLWGPIKFAKLAMVHGMPYAMMIFLLPLILLIAIYWSFYRWWNVKVARRT